LKSDGVVRGRLQNPAATGITLGRLPEQKGPAGRQAAFERLKFAGQLVSAALEDRPRRLGVMVVGVPADAAATIAKALVLAVNAHAFALPAYRSQHDRTRTPASLRLLGLGDRIELTRSEAESEALNLVRWMTSLPPNKLDAGAYRGLLESLATQHGWKMRWLGESQLRRLGAGAFLAVSQGNAARDAGIAHLKYRPSSAGDKPQLALVGKGIVFDTGGTNLKPFKAMLDMHEDMSGSAVALSTLLALRRIGFPHPVDCWLAITENRISATAYKSRDVVTASNGTTIEVIHTDAEGRMALADALALAAREKPELILDYATLTGTCVQALTERYSGAFTNRPQLHPLLIDAGTACGERVWPFPMDADYDEDLKSQVADVVQCSAGGGGDHILAARFLQRFVPEKIPWVHVDLSAASRKGGLAQVPSRATGFGVRFSLALLLDHSDRLGQALGQAAAGGLVKP
jgi:leucyl aminopeptidase